MQGEKRNGEEKSRWEDGLHGKERKGKKEQGGKAV